MARLGVFGQVKPPPGLTINWGNPLTQGLACVMPFNEGSGGIIKNVLAPANNPNGDPVFVNSNTQQSTGTNIGWKYGNRGVGAFQTPANGTGLLWNDPASLAYADDFTLFAIASIDGNSATTRSLMANYEGGSTNIVQWGLDSSNNMFCHVGNLTNTGAAGTNLPVNVGALRAFALTRVGSGGAIKFYLDGTLDQSTTDTSSPGWATAGKWHTLDNTNGNVNWSGQITCFYIWKGRALTDTEVASVSADPWQLFMPAGPQFKNWITIAATPPTFVPVFEDAMLQLYPQ